jgi:hypothetical protein
VPKYLYLSDPGSRWQLADDVDIVELRHQLGDESEAAIQIDVMVNGQLRPLTVRRDQLNPHAVVHVAGARPLRSPARSTTAKLIRADRTFPEREFLLEG